MTINFNDFNDNEKNDITLVYQKACEVLALPNNLEVNLIILTPEQIQTMNKKYRDVDRVTDVLSFPMLESINDISKECDAFLDEVNIGDIYICRERAMEQAKEYGHSVRREMCFLATHGLLHLLGYDHIKEQDEKIMFPLQDKILNLAQIDRNLKD